MFYPAPWLKRGSRFFPCWLAHSWPSRFNELYNRRSRLFSIKIVEICDELNAVIASESGSVVKRFSLRLSSQLLFGVIRIYHRQATVILDDLCKTGGAIIVYQKKQKASRNGARGRARPRAEEDSTSSEDDEEDPRREEARRRTRSIAEKNTPTLIQALPSEITLREDIIQPSVQPIVAPNDGFGETEGDLMRQLETMLGAEGSRAVEASLAYATRLSDATPAGVPQLRLDHIEDLAESMSHLKPFETHRGDADVTNPELQTEAPVPPPASPVRPAQVLPETTAPPAPRAPPAPEPMIEVLSPLEELIEELGAMGLRRGRRRPRARLHGPITDRECRITTEEIKQQLHPYAHCREGRDVISAPRRTPVRAEDLFRRSARGWSHHEPVVSAYLVGNFARNCFALERAHPPRTTAMAHVSPPAVNIAAPDDTRAHHESALVAPLHATVQPAPDSPPVPVGHSTPAVVVAPRVFVDDVEMTFAKAGVGDGTVPTREPYVKLRRLDFTPTNATTTPHTNGAVTADLDVNGIANTTTAAEEAKDRDDGGAKERGSARAKDGNSAGAKKRDNSGAKARDSAESQDGIGTRAKARAQKRDSAPAIARYSAEAQDRDGAGQDRGSAGAQERDGTGQDRGSAGAQDRNGAGGRDSVGAHDRTSGSEPQLGSLDRTSVWLSESETDSHKTMKDTWGPHATMHRIIEHTKNEGSGPLTVDDLMLMGPPSPPGKKRLMVACCFASLLKLKSIRYVRLIKDPVTSSIVDIQVGEFFDD